MELTKELPKELTNEDMMYIRLASFELYIDNNVYTMPKQIVPGQLVRTLSCKCSHPITTEIEIGRRIAAILIKNRLNPKLWGTNTNPEDQWLK